MDATLLETEYDAVIVGTGMAEAVLAGALARVGKKVLHLDQNDYYGSNYASFPLEQFRRWTRNEAIAPRAFHDDHEHDSSESAPVAPLELPSTARVVPMESAFKCHLVDESFNVTDDERAAILRQSSQFSIDVNPRLVLSSEEIVQLLIESGVGRYLEFAAMERTYIHVDDATNAAASGDSIWEVPCSKKDVFASKLLGMVEKRMLMKFLQFVADYGETHILGEDVKSKNERELALGRSLKRPQNKVNQVEAAQGSEIAPYLDGPFQDLLSKHFKLSPKLQQVVVYCVALASFPVETQSDSSRHVQQMSAKEGLAAVYRYVASIGRFTGNAFLVPLYGVGEITQSFCRLCAVYGGIYVLRAPIDGFVMDGDANAVVGIRCAVGENGEKAVLKAKHVITNASYLPCFSANAVTSSQILRGVFLLNRSLREGMNRFMIVVPPRDATLGNPFAIQVIQLDHGAYICPKDQFLIQITTPLPSDWHGETARQRELMITVINKLITSAEAEIKTRGQSPQREGSEEPSKPSILWQAVFAMDHYLFPYSNVTKRAEYVAPDELPSNLWVCETPFAAGDANANGVNPLEIHLESSSVNARAIFDKICPGEAFLPKSASAEQAEREDMEDEEDAVLRAAQKLAEQADLKDDATPSEGVHPVDAPSAESLQPITVPPTVDGVETQSE